MKMMAPENFTEHIISSGSLPYTYSVEIIDLDQDGDKDILTEVIAVEVV